MKRESKLINLGDKIIAVYFLFCAVFQFALFLIAVLKIPLPIWTGSSTPLLVVPSGILFFCLGWGFWRKLKWALIATIVMSSFWIVIGIYALISDNCVLYEYRNPYSHVISGAIILLYVLSSRIALYFVRKKHS